VHAVPALLYCQVRRDSESVSVSSDHESVADPVTIFVLLLLLCYLDALSPSAVEGHRRHVPLSGGILSDEAGARTNSRLVCPKHD